MIDYLSIGKRIKKNRLSRGITQEVLAERVNVSIPHISRIENGFSSPSLQTLVDICNVLGITIDDLMQDSLLAAKPHMNKRLEELLVDCTATELNFIANVIPALLREIRNLPER